ncbi:MAG: caspase family protein [Planctomycetaceae bacterium]|nr:caspase family protein [Planctomycetaceae bacterium]
MRTTSSFFLALLFLTAWNLSPSSAQNGDLQHGAVVPQPEMPGGPPRIILNKRGPSGVTHGLAFSPDAALLYTAGVDKAVDTWALKRDQNPPPGELGRLRLTHLKSIPWEISRGHRGLIFALDSSPQRLAIGGYSARQGGDVILIDRNLGEVEQSLPPERINGVENGHTNRIVEVSFSPSGNRLVSVDEFGEVRVWEGPRFESKVIQASSPNARERLHHVRFLDESHVVIAISVTSGAVNQAPNVFAIHDLNDPDQVRNLFRARPYQITALSNYSENQTWCAAYNNGTIEVFQGIEDLKSFGTIRKERDPIACDMSLSADGRWLLIANLAAGNALELWDLGQRPYRLAGQFNDTSMADIPRCRISADGRYGVSQHGQAGIFHVFDLEKAQAENARNLLDERIDFSRQQELITEVEFLEMTPNEVSNKSYVLRLERPDGEFMLFETALFQPINTFPNIVRFDEDSIADGWELVPPALPANTTDAQSITLVNTKQRLRTTIRLDRGNQGVYGMHCWIPAPPDQKGVLSKRPAAIAIGCRESYGVFVYRLPTRPNEEAELVRYFRDHQDELFSVAASQDGRILASSSRDQTLKIWNLKSIAQDIPAQDLQWGAEFQIQGDQLLVQNVIPGGIAENRDLANGDVITRLQHGVSGREANDARGMRTILNRQQAWEDLVVYWSRGNQEFSRRITPAWEPLVNLFIKSKTQWIAYTPQGFFKSSPIEGDRLVNYLLNRGPGRPPKIVQAAQARLNFDVTSIVERPTDNLFGSYLSTLSLPEAFTSTGLQYNPQSYELAEEIRKIPEIRIRRPYLGERIPDGEPIPVVVDFLSEPDGHRLPIRNVSVDGILLDPPDQKKQIAGGVRLVWDSIPAQLCSQLSLLQVRALREQAAGVTDDRVHAVEDVAFLPEVEFKPQYHVHLIVIACADYNGNSYEKLNTPLEDAGAIIQLFSAPNPTYALDSLIDFRSTTLKQNGREYSVRPDDFDGAVKSIKSAIERGQSQDPNRQDLVFVFLAGHGDVRPRAEEATTDPRTFYYVPEETDDTKAALQLPRIGLSWSSLAKVIDLKARVTFMLDTCHSHTLVDDPTRPTSLRNFGRSSSLTTTSLLTATSGDTELAIEAPGLGYGFFTLGLLASAQRADGYYPVPGDKDQQIDFVEWVNYCLKDVEMRSNREQLPTFSSTKDYELPSFAYPLFRAGGLPGGLPNPPDVVK